MLSQDLNSKKFAFSQIASGVLYNTGSKLIRQQTDILKTYYNRQTGATLANLSSQPFSVVASSQRVTLLIKYLSSIRFLDLKKTSKGKNKKVYQPIYNKPLYGFIYGYAYSRLRYGFTQSVTEATIDPLKIVMKKPIEL